MPATIKDVARLAGVSIKTVSRVVNHEAHVSEAVRNRVQDAIDSLAYAPNISARRLVQQRSYVLCILLHTGGLYQAALIDKILDVAYEYNYDILFQTYFPALARSKNKLASLIGERRIDGLVTTPPCDSDEFINELVHASHIPLVQITPYNRSDEFPFVTGDDYSGALLLCEHLIALGHRRIAFFMGPRNHRTNYDRFFGYQAALEKHAIAYDDRLVKDSEFNFEGGYNATRLLLGMLEPPSAIFAGNDEAALGAIYALQELGLKVPRQISVVGFDDLAGSTRVWPGLTTVHHPVSEIAEMALSMLVAMLDGQPLENRQAILPTRLVVRGSTAAPPLKG